MVLSIDKVTELKKQLSDNFVVYLHLHDACGAQSFSFDKPVDETVQKWISEYVQGLGGTVHFSDSGNQFNVL